MPIYIMNYTNQDVRRRDRLLDEPSARELLIGGKYGILSMQAENGGAYAVPISYVWDRGGSIYFHCAPEGRKIHCLALCNKVSFCVVGSQKVIPEKFSTLYESIILEGKAYIGLPEDERMKALELLIDKYSFEFKEKGIQYAKKSFFRTEVIKLKIEKWSGKSRK